MTTITLKHSAFGEQFGEQTTNSESKQLFETFGHRGAVKSYQKSVPIILIFVTPIFDSIFFCQNIFFNLIDCSTVGYGYFSYLCRGKNIRVMRAVIYARVSTNGQDYERQLDELRSYAARMDYEVVKEFSEKVSGAKKVEEREALSDLLGYVGEHKVDKVLIYECSRLSRRAVDFLAVIEQLSEQGVSVVILQNGLETLQPDGNPNPIAQLVLGILAQFNSMERGLIRSRMESGYNHYRANGGKVGRKKGYRKSNEQMKSEYAEELRLLRKGYSLANVSKLTGTAINTLRKVKRIA